MNMTRSEKLVEALKRKGVNHPCPRCGHPHFQMVAETRIEVREDPTGDNGNGLVVPVVVIGCKNCGYLTQHSLGILDMMPEVAHAG